MLITIMTDASWCGEYKVAGYGYWIASARGKEGGGGRIAAHPVEGINCAEMMAIGNAMYHGLVSGLIQPGDDLLVQTDSQHAMRALTGVPVTKTEAQCQVILYIHGLLNKYGLTVRYRHVKAHTNTKDKRSLANSMCDRRAKEHMRAARSVIKCKEIEAML